MKNTRNKVVLTESQLNSVIAESVRQVLSESFEHWKSPKAAAIVKQYGIGNTNLYTHYLLTRLYDEDVIGVSDHCVYNEEDGMDSLPIGSGKYIIYTTKNDDEIYDLTHYCEYDGKSVIDLAKPNNEFKGNYTAYDSIYTNRFMPMTTRARDARNLRRVKRERTPYKMNNLRQGKDRYGNDNKPIPYDRTNKFA